MVSYGSEPVNVADLLPLPGVEPALGRLEAALRASVASEDPFLHEVASHLIASRGKLLRPLMAIATAQAAGAPVDDRVIRGAVAVELVHLGSLYHDDVMDEADSRHGVQSVNAKWGNLVAIVAGDFLLARASEIASSISLEVSALLGSTIARLCEGQVGEVQTAFQTNRTELAYFRSIDGKTASLLSASCRIGALTAGLDGPAVAAFTTFGSAFGMAFQVRDDVLDVIGTDESLGKPAGNDMVQGVYTLPVLRALAHPVAGPELAGLLGAPLDEPTRDKARDIVRNSPGIDEALAVARCFADEARTALACVGSSPELDALAGFAHRLLDHL